MRRRTLCGIAAGLSLCVGLAVAADRLFVTDEERVLALADDLAGTLTAQSLRARSEGWVDLGRAPLELSALGASELYREGEGPDLFARADRGLQSVYGTEVRVLSSRADVDGDQARLTTRLMVPRLGLAHGTWDLERHGDDWLVVRVALTR
ncbi:MAG: hypothetical protein AB8I08_30465 [Sandaracinaceae bacterium]